MNKPSARPYRHQPHPSGTWTKTQGMEGCIQSEPYRPRRSWDAGMTTGGGGAFRDIPELSLTASAPLHAPRKAAEQQKPSHAPRRPAEIHAAALAADGWMWRGEGGVRGARVRGSEGPERDSASAAFARRCAPEPAGQLTLLGRVSTEALGLGADRRRHGSWGDTYTTRRAIHDRHRHRGWSWHGSKPEAEVQLGPLQKGGMPSGADTAASVVHTHRTV
jgi:hypothetical protein